VRFFEQKPPPLICRENYCIVATLFTNAMSEEIAMPAMERPGVKDILLGRGHNVFNHIGNRRFRKLVDLHIQEYVESPHRKEKTAMVRDVIDLLTRAGYRFLKSNKDGIFEELDFAQILRKVRLVQQS
jgi:hypothetical protein